MSYVVILVAVWILLIAAMALGWVHQRRANNAGWVDVFWTFATGAAGVIVALWPIAGQPPTTRQWLVAALVAIWALRLGLYITFRVARGPEDLRYVEFRKMWGGDFQSNLFWFMQYQAYGSIIFPLAIMVAARNPAPGLRIADWIAVAILVISIGGESLADWQLQKFKSDSANKGSVCDRGLWSVSRHPNYFFEWIMWFAYPVMAIDLTGNYWWGLLTLGAPALMYRVIVYQTGIPPLEAHMVRSRGDVYRAYRTRTSRFVPMPKRGL